MKNLLNLQKLVKQAEKNDEYMGDDLFYSILDELKSEHDYDIYFSLPNANDYAYRIGRDGVLKVCYLVRGNCVGEDYLDVDSWKEDEEDEFDNEYERNMIRIASHLSQYKIEIC